MTSILQNVTKDNVLLQLKRIAVGAALVTPVVSVGYLIAYLVSKNYLNGMTLYVIFQTTLGIFLLWTVGGAFESYRNMRRIDKERKERQTINAFKKLGHGNT